MGRVPLYEIAVTLTDAEKPVVHTWPGEGPERVVRTMVEQYNYYGQIETVAVQQICWGCRTPLVMDSDETLCELCRGHFSAEPVSNSVPAEDR